MGGEVKSYSAHMRVVRRIVKFSKREKPRFDVLKMNKKIKQANQ